MAAIAGLLPDTDAGREAAVPRPAGCSRSSAAAAGEKLAYVRMFDGELRVRQRIDAAGGPGRQGRGTGGPRAGSWVRADVLAAGQIGRVSGLAAVRVGDGFGAAARAEPHHFPPPTLEASVAALRPGAGPGAACRPGRSWPTRTR